MRRSQFWVAALSAVTFFSAAHAQTTASQPPNIRHSQGMPPRAAPTDYASQARVGQVTIAAEFAGHSVPRGDHPLATDDYVVVEVALFGPASPPVSLSPGNFSLRVNGKKKTLESEPYAFVDRSLKDPEWVAPESAASKQSKTSFGTGDQSNKNEPPPVVHVPIELQRAMAQYVEQSALPEGNLPLPKAGLLFFPYHGPRKNIRSLELVYSGPLGKTSFDLQP